MVNCCEAEAGACAKVQMRLGRVQKCKGGGSRFRWWVAESSLKGEPETGWLAGVLGRAVIAISAVRDRGMGVVGA